MKQKSKILTSVVLILAVAGVVRLHSNKTTSIMSDLALVNIEALTAEENDCHYQNGYRNWYTERNSSYSRRQQFYDCCNKLQEGYDPYGTCN